MNIFDKWLSGLKPKQKQRSYTHFDSVVDLDDSSHFLRVKSTIRNLKTHHFLPFIKFIKTDIRYKKNVNGHLERSAKRRPIMYAGHLDSHIYSFYAYIWGLEYEKQLKSLSLTNTVTAYRKIEKSANTSSGKSNIELAADVFEYIKTTRECTVFIADITNFFDSIDHKLLKNKLERVLGVKKLNDIDYKVLRSLCSYRYILNDSQLQNNKFTAYRQAVDNLLRKGCSVPEAVYEAGKGLVLKNTKPFGIPQGSSLSGLLANIYMIDFDNNINVLQEVMYRRYSDDIVIICNNAFANKVKKQLDAGVRESRLKINNKKLFIADFKTRNNGDVQCVGLVDGNGVRVKNRTYIDYLGFEFDGNAVVYRKKTLKKSRGKAIRKTELYKERQDPRKNPGKNHGDKKKITHRGDSYLVKAAKGMFHVSQRVSRQSSNFQRFLHKIRK